MTFDVVEASIAAQRRALEHGETTAVALVEAYLARIERYPDLNAVPVLAPEALDEARASDERRARGAARGPLDGIAYTVKDSFLTRGLPAACGSPAFAGLIAYHDAFSVERLRAAGAILLGRTTMPPMANGGMQRGLHGRAESPYNRDYLTSAFGSGSSNGSGTAVAASLCAFGLGEETWSSGRAPASHNGLVAYTPSRGVISVRGNWPLVPTMDVVVPHTRSVPDLLDVLDVLVAPDADTRGDLWRSQPWIEIAGPVGRPPRYRDLADPDALRGARIAVPRMYVGRDDGPHPVRTRASILDLWRAAADDLRDAGAELVETDFPAVREYEAGALVDRGWVPQEFFDAELWDLAIGAWDDFLAANGDPHLHRLADVDGALIFPHPPGALPDRYDSADLPARYTDDAIDLAEYVVRARAGVTHWTDVPGIEAGLRGLETARRVLLEDWMDEHRFDAVVFPTMADVAPADADVNPASADVAWRNGTWVANGNLAIRHLGIPTVTVTMGSMADTAMPAGLTFAGRADDDPRLLALAGAFETSRPRRLPPGL